MNRVYLDYAATEPLREEALAAMMPFLSLPTSNPASSYASAREAKKALEDARETIAGILNAKPSEIYFTSGGTESDNWALRSSLRAGKTRIVTSSAEHHAILDTCDGLREEGYEIVQVDVDEFAAPVLQSIENAAGETTALISVMLANNELGTITDLAPISGLAQERGIALHTDAVAACGHTPIDVNNPHLDMLSCSAHKFGGPVGVGALYIREGLPVHKVMRGGSQERNLRAGTQNVASAVGMAVALSSAVSQMEKENERIIQLRDGLRCDLEQLIPAVRFTSPQGSNCLSGHLHFILPGVLSEAALVYFDRIGFECSAGSACTAGSTGPSHVLLAAGIEAQAARCAVRVSIGRNTRTEDLEQFARAAKELCERASRISYSNSW